MSMKDKQRNRKGQRLVSMKNSEGTADMRTALEGTGTKKIMNVNRRNMKGETPLHVACIKNDVDKVRQLLTSPNIDVNTRDNAGWTPLHEACNHGNIECVRELLNFRPDTLASGSKTSVPELDIYLNPGCGTTVLHDAVANNHVDVVKLLVAVGGQRLVSMKNSEGETVWDFSLTADMRTALEGTGPSSGHQENEAALYVQDEQMDPQPTPVKQPSSQQPERLQTTPKRNMNVKRETPLHTACIKKDVDKVRQLLTSPDIDVNAQDNAGWTPLHEACNHGNIQCMQELLNFRPNTLALGSKSAVPKLDLYLRPDCGTTVLHDAVTNNHVDVVKLLVAVGGQRLVSMKNSEGKTVWDFTLTADMRTALEGTGPSSGHQENEAALYVQDEQMDLVPTPVKQPSSQQPEKPQTTPKKNMNVKRKNMKGETPLHVACINNDVDKVCQLLTSPNIDVNARDYAGWTPLHEACNHGNIQCVQELLNFRPDMLASGSKTDVPKLDLYLSPKCGTTVLHDAVDNNHVDVVKLLVAVGGQKLVSMKNSEGETVWDFPLTPDMRTALEGTGPSLGHQENEAASAHLVPDCERPRLAQPAPDCNIRNSEGNYSNNLLPHPSQYCLFFRTPGDSSSSNRGSSIPLEELEKFVVTLMFLLQSYIKTQDLHTRAQGRVDLSIVLEQSRQRKNKPSFQAAGKSTSSATAGGGQPSSQQHNNAFTDSTSSRDTLQGDSEVYADLSRYMEGFKAHLRQLGLAMMDMPRAQEGMSTRNDPSTFLITRLWSIIDFYAGHV
ncbi:uncharacterized protein [Diadema antillarum]|uniref:uncharacterized protein n=1 Tax=Diadema antillarum TaxID=105358 RepID=UPI003A89E584